MTDMARPAKVPGKDVLRRWKDAGLTQVEMVDRIEQEFGQQVTRSAVANAMARYGLAEEAPRYNDHVPWRVGALHVTAHPIRMLRLLGRRDTGGELNPREQKMLDSWLSELAERKLIVAYCPDDVRGLYYISSKHKDHKKPIPVRRKALKSKL